MLILLFCLAGISVKETFGANRHALLIGCSHYPKLAKRYQLDGPRNDVFLFGELLQRNFGFRPEDITTLSEDGEMLEQLPSRANIGREFGRLAEQVAPGDQVVILLAGHGTQQPDVPDDDDDDFEPDGLDECFLARDVGYWDEENLDLPNAIRDDELRAWLHQLSAQGAFVWIVVDACHSGTMVRGAVSERARHVPPSALGISHVTPTARGQETSSEKQAGVGSDLLDGTERTSGIVAMYASMPWERTVEQFRSGENVSEGWHGLFTSTCCEILSRSQQPMTYTELTSAVQREYSRKGRRGPTPLVEGSAREQQILGVNAWKPVSDLVLGGTNDRGTELNAGYLHGLTPQSVLRLEGDSSASSPAPAVGYLQVKEVGPLRSVVEPIEHLGLPKPTQLLSGTPCSLVYQDFGDLRLKVALARGESEPESPLRKRVARALSAVAGEQESLLQVVDDPVEADWIAHLIDSQLYLASGRGWTVAADGTESSDSGPRFGPATIDSNLEEWLREYLQGIAKATNLLTLVTTGSKATASPGLEDINVQVEMFHKPANSEADWQKLASPERIALHTGDHVRFEVANKGHQDADVTLLFVDSSYGIELILPEETYLTDNRIPPYATYDVGPFVVEAPAGIDHLVAIAVTPGRNQPVMNFGCFAQPSLKTAMRSDGRTRGRGDVPALETPLGKLLLNAIYAKGNTRGQTVKKIKEYSVEAFHWQVIKDE